MTPGQWGTLLGCIVGAALGLGILLALFALWEKAEEWWDRWQGGDRWYW